MTLESTPPKGGFNTPPVNTERILASSVNTDRILASSVNTGRILASSLATEVARGGRVVSSSDNHGFVEFIKPTRHGLHLVLTLLTLGTWAPIWLAVWLYHVTTNKTVSIIVDEYGNVLRTEL